MRLLESIRVLAGSRAIAQRRMLNHRLRAIDEELARLNEEIQLQGRRAALAQTHLVRQQELVSESRQRSSGFHGCGASCSSA